MLIFKTSVLAGLTAPDLLFIFSLFTQTGPKGLSTSLALGACPCSPASSCRRAMALCPPSRSLQSCRPITSARAVTGRPTLRNPFRSYVVGFSLLEFVKLFAFQWYIQINPILLYWKNQSSPPVSAPRTDIYWWQQGHKADFSIRRSWFRLHFPILWPWPNDMVKSPFFTGKTGIK
jgi:hypothetical protein